MAEIGHASLKRKKPLYLVDAAWEDVCSTILQEEEIQKFLEGKGVSSGKGPSTISNATKEKKNQSRRTKEYKTMFKEGNYSVVDGGGAMFIPSKKARHKAPSSYCTFNPVQGTQNEQPGNARPPLMNLNTNAQEPDEENPPLLCFLQGFNITTCYGCKKKFDLKLRNPPKDLILKRLVVRDRLINGQWVKGWNKSWAYFHLSMDCIRKSKSTLEAADVYIPNIILQQMHQQHVDFLIRKGWWSVMRKKPSV